MKIYVKLSLFITIFLFNGFVAHAQVVQPDDSQEFVMGNVNIFYIEKSFTDNTPIQDITLKYTSINDRLIVLAIRDSNNINTLFQLPGVLATSTATPSDITFDLSGYDWSDVTDQNNFGIRLTVIGTNSDVSFYGGSPYTPGAFFDDWFQVPTGFYPYVEVNGTSTQQQLQPPASVPFFNQYFSIDNCVMDLDRFPLNAPPFAIAVDWYSAATSNLFNDSNSFESVSNQFFYWDLQTSQPISIGGGTQTFDNRNINGTQRTADGCNTDVEGNTLVDTYGGWFSRLDNNSPAGLYTIVLNDTYAASWFWDGSTASVYNLQLPSFGNIDQNYDISKVVDVLIPTANETTSTTTVDVSVRYQQLPSFSLIEDFTTRYEIRNALNNDLVFAWERDFSPSSIDFFRNDTIDLEPGSYIISAFFQDLENAIVSETDDIFFNVLINTYEQQTGLPFPGANAGELSQNDCTTFDVGCQFQRAIVFLFYPSETLLNRFQSVWQTLRNIPPFGYITATLDSLERLDNTATAAFSFGNIPFMSTIFTPMHGLISSILWALFAIWFFLHRLRHIEI